MLPNHCPDLYQPSHDMCLPVYTFASVTRHDCKVSLRAKSLIPDTADGDGQLVFALQILDPSNVKRIVEEADGYQPHLIAPEMGYRRLLQECLVLFKGPADTAVGEVHHVLRSIVASTINSEDCKNLQQYTSLKREIVATASSSLGELCLLMHSLVSAMSMLTYRL